MIEDNPVRRSLSEAVGSAVRTCLDDVGPSLTRVAGTVGVRPRTLQRRLARVGLTYQQVIDEVRYERARQLLGSPGTSIGEVAIQVGYADPAHFSRAFRRWAGLSPRAYRDRWEDSSAAASRAGQHARLIRTAAGDGSRRA